MWLINIIAFFIATIFVANKAKENIAEALPVTTCGLIFLLYGLAYFRCLSWIDFISIGIIAGSIIYLVKMNTNKRQTALRVIMEMLIQPATIMIICSTVLVSFLVQDRIALWWDDINFWATDVKSIYYLNGFAKKYGNVAPEFGDYPPGVQLFKWWFLHFRPDEFDEGLMFAGYYVLNMLLLAPLFSKIGKLKNKMITYVQYFLGCVCMFALPSVVETFYLEGNCSDLPMGIAYGLFLWSVIDEKNHNIKFSYLRQSFALSLVVICKNTGFQWVIYGLIFGVIYRSIVYREKGKEVLLSFIGMTILPIVIEGSWLLSCLLKRRVAKLTGAGIKMAVSGKVPEVDYRLDLVKNYIKGFIIEPIHRQNTIGIDLSVMVFLFLVAAAIWFIGKKQIISLTEKKVISGFFCLSGIIVYGITLIAHLTIFVTELQYLEARVMTASIERYGAPFTMGLLYVLWGIWTSREHKWKGYAYIIAIGFVCLLAQWPGIYDALWGYRDSIEVNKAQRTSMIEEDALLFSKELKKLEEDKGTRVLYLRDGDINHRVKDTYINYAVSPIGVVYGDITENLYQTENCRLIIEQSHASYLYADYTQLKCDQMFEGMTDEFCYETIYKIETENGTIVLVPVEKSAETQ